MKGFVYVKLKKNEKLRDVRPAFFKECFSLFVTGTVVPVPFRQVFTLAFFLFFILYCMVNGRTSRGRGEASPFPFWKIEKKCLDLEKNALIVRIYKLNFSFKMHI